MATYIVYKEGALTNSIEIEPAQVEEYESMMGVTLTPPPPPSLPGEDAEKKQMETALNELGVETRKE